MPCFNSTSIISLIHKIPNLSEYYVLFNDDTFIIRQVKIEDFFNEKTPVLRGEWKKFYEYQNIRLVFYKILKYFKLMKNGRKKSLKFSMQNGAKLAGIEGEYYLRRFHNPIPMKKSTIVSFFDNNKKILEKNIKYKFRNNKNQFITETLSNHLEIKNSNYSISNPQLTYFRSYKNILITKFKLYKTTFNKGILFITFQSLESANKKTIKIVLNWLKRRLNKKLL